jgi:hypothetical protein
VNPSRHALLTHDCSQEEVSAGGTVAMASAPRQGRLVRRTLFAVHGIKRS